MVKKRTSSAVSSGLIDKWYDIGLENGCLGGKLMGRVAVAFLCSIVIMGGTSCGKPWLRKGCGKWRWVLKNDGSMISINL